MSRNFDVGVVGLGALGAAVAWRLARSGVRVVGFDSYAPPHSLGSTHGRSRIIREAYYEHPSYVPIVQEAYRLWAELEAAAGTRVFQACGGLMVGAPDSELIRGARDSARQHALPVEEWSAGDITARVRTLCPTGDMVGLFEPRAGVLDPENAVRAMLGQAAHHGADLRFGQPIREWSQTSGGLRLVSEDDSATDVGQVVVAAGGWLPALVQELTLPLQIERAVQFWFPRAVDDRFSPARFPVFLLERTDGRLLYGLPDQGHGLKLAEHHHGEVGPLASLRRDVTPDETASFLSFARPWVSGLPSPSSSAVCFYTNTPDGHFIVDRHPRQPEVYLVSACSGHGFKFAPALGEIVAGELRGATSALLAQFRLSRFTG